MTANIRLTLHSAAQQLKSSSDSPRLDAEVLLAWVLQKNRTYLYAHDDTVLSLTQQQQFDQLVQQRRAGMPIAYLTGLREFWDHVFVVNAHTLIPRPETECLLTAVLLYVTQDNANILDLGTGSGAIALSLAAAKPHWHLTAVDKYPLTLAVAQTNAQRLHLSNVTFCLSDWFQTLPAVYYDVIVSNPPYIKADDAHLQQRDLRFEPPAALVGGEDGLADLRHIITHSHRHLQPGGFLFLEHGYNQKQQVVNLFIQHGFPEPKTLHDQQGHDRVTYGRFGMAIP